MTNEEKREQEHHRNKVRTIIEIVREYDGDDDKELSEMVSAIIGKPIQQELYEDTMGASPNVLDPCGPFADVEDLKWYMNEYPDCFDHPNFWDW